MSLPEATRRRIVEAIYSEADLYGCRIGYYGGSTCSQLSGGYAPSVNYARIIVIVEESHGTGIDIRVQSLLSPVPTTVPEVPETISNSSRVNAELLGAGLSCGFAIVAGVGVIAGAAAEVPTAGASTALVIVSWIGFASSAVQCVNGIARSVEAVRNPEDNSLQRWDDNRIYSTSMLIVDVIGVATAIASLPAAARNLFAVLERRGALITSEMLSSMSRAERQAAIRAAIQRATRTPEGQRELARALQEAGLSERQAAQALVHGAGSGRRAQTVLRAINEVTAARLHTQLAGALSGGLSPLVSATPSRITGSASGSVNSLIVNVLNLGPGGDSGRASSGN